MSYSLFCYQEKEFASWLNVWAAVHTAFGWQDANIQGGICKIDKYFNQMTCMQIWRTTQSWSSLSCYGPYNRIFSLVEVPTYALSGQLGSSLFFLQQYCGSIPIQSYASPLCHPSSSILMQISLSHYNPLAFNICTLAGLLLMLIFAFNLLQLLSTKCLGLCSGLLVQQIFVCCFWVIFSWILKLRIPMAAHRLVRCSYDFLLSMLICW